MSELHNWLKSLPGGLHLERCSKEFEIRGFKTLSSLKYLQTGDIDAFFPSPEKLLLAEKRILECEIKAIVDTENKRFPLKPVELSQRFKSNSGTSANSIYSAFPSHLPATLPTAMNSLPPVLATTTAARNVGSPANAPLERKAAEMKDNVLVLEVQISSASGELQKLKAQQDEFMPLAAVRGRICNRCHQAGHMKTTCKERPCESINNCKIREKHPEFKNKISSLQAELKDLQKQQEKRKSELENFLAAREKSKSSFFAVMRPRLRMQNLPKYADRLKLDKDLLVLQRALKNEIPKWSPEEGDWQLPMIIEHYHHAKVAAYLPAAQGYFVSNPSHEAAQSSSAGARGFQFMKPSVELEVNLFQHQ